MKMPPKIRKNGRTVFEGVLDATDTESLGTSWADVWNALSRQSAEAATLVQRLNERVLDQLNGAEVRLTRM
jgi:hypothetical protein